MPEEAELTSPEARKRAAEMIARGIERQARERPVQCQKCPPGRMTWNVDAVCDLHD